MEQSYTAADQAQGRLSCKAALDAEDDLGRNANYLVHENGRLKQMKNTNCKHYVLS